VAVHEGEGRLIKLKEQGRTAWRRVGTKGASGCLWGAQKAVQKRGGWFLDGKQSTIIDKQQQY